MAPFGKKFLKARLKNRSEGRDGEPGKEIQVWVRREEKTVCGLTKHTTCAEVVQALLEDRASRPPDTGGAPPAEYCLLERWKGFERALPPLTRILRLWTAWGDEQPFVQFVLVSARDYGPRLAGSPPPAPPPPPPGSKVGDQAPAQYVRSLPVDRQKRMVRKAFRKLGKMREQERATSPGDDGRIGGLVQLIVSQDRALREQALRMRELDREIERAEWGLGAALETPPHLGSAGSAARLAADDPGGADGLGRLDRQLERHRNLIQRLTRDIDAEMRGARSAGAGAGEPAGGGGLGPGAAPPPDDAAETERVRRDLEHSMYRGLALHAQLADLDRELELNQAVLASKSREREMLAEQLSALRADDPAHGSAHDPAHLTEEPGHSSAHDSAHDPAHLTEEPGHAGAAHTELRKVLSHGDGTDTDSDTGISSTHSQDSLSPCGDVRPPLETQV